MISSQRPRSFWFWEAFPNKYNADDEKSPPLVVKHLRNNLIVEFSSGVESPNRDGWSKLDLGQTVWHFYSEPVTDGDLLFDIAFGDDRRSAYFKAQKEGFFEMVFIPLLRIIDGFEQELVVQFIDKTVDNYVAILKSPVEVDILFLPIFMVSGENISMLEKLNKVLFEKGYNLATSLHRKIMPRIIVISDTTSSNISLEPDELSLIVADFLQFWIVETALYPSAQSPIMRKIRQEGLEWETPEDMAPYITFMTGTMYLPFKHILNWASHYTLQKMVSFARDENFRWPEIDNVKLHIELSKAGLIAGHSPAGDIRKNINDDSESLSLEPKRLGVFDKIDKIPERWRIIFRKAIRYAQSKALSSVEQLNRNVRTILKDGYQKLREGLLDIFENLSPDAKRISLRPLIDKLEQEIQKTELRLTELEMEKVAVFDIEKKIKDIESRVFQEIKSLAEKDKRDPAALWILTPIILVMVSLLIFWQRGSKLSLLIGGMALLTYLLPLLTHFREINNRYTEIREESERSLRRTVRDYIAQYENAVIIRLLLKIGHSYISRLSKIKSKVIELDNKFSSFMDSAIPGKPPYSPSHIPVLDEEKAYAEFLGSQKILLDSFAEDDFKDFLKIVKRYVTEDIKWDWEALENEIRDRLKRVIGDAQELFSKAFDFAFTRIESTILQRLRNRVVNLTPLQLSGSTNYELWGLIPTEEPKFMEIIQDRWNVPGQNVFVNKSNQFRLAAIMLVKLVWDLPISAFSGGTGNEKQ